MRSNETQHQHGRVASRLDGHDRQAGMMAVGHSPNALHLMGSRVLGFTQDLFDDSPDLDVERTAALAAQLGGTHPYVVEVALAATHDGGLGGCDTNLEFEFALDVILDGLGRLRDAA